MCHSHFKGRMHLNNSIRFKKKEFWSSMWYCHWSLQHNFRLLGSSPQVNLQTFEWALCRVSRGFTGAVCSVSPHCTISEDYTKDLSSVQFFNLLRSGISSMGFGFIHRSEKQMLEVPKSFHISLIWRAHMSWVKQSNRSLMQCYLFQLSSGNAPQVSHSCIFVINWLLILCSHWNVHGNWQF